MGEINKKNWHLMNHKCMMVEFFWSTKSEMRNFQINKKNWRPMNQKRVDG